MENNVARNCSMQDRMVYEADEIQEILGLGRSKTYEFLRDVYQCQHPFRVIRIGKLLRVPKADFDRWLLGEE